MLRRFGTTLMLALGAATPALAAITAANVATLVPKWTLSTPLGGVTGGAALADGRIYVAGIDSQVRALDPDTGAVIWSASAANAVTGTVLLTDDGGLCVGGLGAIVKCFNRSDGSERWSVNLVEPSPGAVWAQLNTANGRLFVGIASVSDNPCTRGRLVALDLATGQELWRFYTVPNKVCSTDTAITCTQDNECPASGTCVKGIGGGVTATVALDPTGDFVYMNTVGCYTSPSIGESDSVFKIDASNGQVTWRRRVNDPEQYGACVNDTSVDCGTNAFCSGVGGVCQTKQFYHDFGFLNAPLRLDVPDGMGERTLIVAASKNGTIYGLDETNGTIAWSNAVVPTPVTPGFAGFGLFNGAITFGSDRVFAALNNTIPLRVCSNDHSHGCSSDGDCSNGGVCPPEPKHLMAFDPASGDILWSEEIGRGYSSVTVANGIVFAGTNATDGDGNSSLFAHDAVTGARLATLPMPGASVAHPLVTANSVIVGYGQLGPGGLRAFSLCGNGNLDDGEQCDDGNGAAGDCCSPSCTFDASGATCGTDDGNACTASACDGAGTCVPQTVTGSCDDGDACTSNDACAGSVCGGSPAKVSEIVCALGQLEDSPCGAEALPKGLAKAVHAGVQRAGKMVQKAAASAGKTAKREAARRVALKVLQGLGKKVDAAANTKKAARKISADCRTALSGLVGARTTTIQGFDFGAP